MKRFLEFLGIARLFGDNHSRREHDLDDEIRAHVEMAVQERMARGESREEAEHAVRREFGNEARVKEVTRSQWRGVVGFWTDRLRQDLRLGLRALKRHPRYSVASVLTLSIGIGAAVTIFSMVETVLLRPLPYHEPERLVLLETHLVSSDELDGSSVPNVEDWGAMSGALEGITYFRRPRVSQVTIFGEFPQLEQEGLVGAGFFEIVDVPPVAGRTFTPEETEAGDAVAVLRQDLWTELFGVQDFRLGRTLSIGGVVHDVVGVLPSTFGLPTPETRLWRPLTATEWWRQWGTSREADGVMALGRLRGGFELEEARIELDGVAAVLRQEYEANAGKDIRVNPLSAYFRADADTRIGLSSVLAAVLLLLMLACANVAGLTTARGTWRSRELGVRSALGARRLSLIRQLLAESLVLAVIAVAIGLALAHYATEIARSFGPADLPGFAELSLSPAAIAFASVTGLLALALFGILPAFRASAVAPGSVLHSRPGGIRYGRRGRRTDDFLVGAQVAVAMILLVGGGLLVESYLRARSSDPGFEAENLAVVSLNLPESTYPGDPELISFHQLTRERLEALPQVEAAGAITGFFLERSAGTDPRGRSTRRLAPEGGAADWPGGTPPRVEGHGVTVGYLEAMAIPLREGRYFEEGDLDLTPFDGTDVRGREAIVISESMADLLWPAQDPLGRGLQFGVDAFDPDEFAYQVVGVVADVRREGLDIGPQPAFYIGDITPRMDLSVRTSGSASEAISAIRATLREIDPGLPVSVRAAGDVFRERLSSRRFQTALLFAFAILALALSAAGIYALVSYHVASRTREIGLRSALGAPRPSIVIQIVTRGGGPVAIGLGVGLVGAAALSGSLRSVLFEVEPLDPLAYVLAAALLLATALSAAAVPALRATRIDPLEALRAEP